MGLNKIHIIGRVGNDPEIKKVGESDLANFDMAVSEKFTTKDGRKVENTEWLTIVVWGGQVKIVNDWIKKGSKLYIGGKLKIEKWEDKNGVKRSKATIVAQEIEMLDGKPKASQEPSASTTEGEQQPEGSDDLPF